MFSGRFSGCRATVLGRRFNQVASAAQTEALKPVLIDSELTEFASFIPVGALTSEKSLNSSSWAAQRRY